MYSHNRNKHSRRDYYDEGHSRQSSPPPRSSSHRDGNISTIVAEHYNSINNRDVKERRKSKIYHMRSFNNWIKSVIIRDTIARLRAEDSKKEDLVVLDLCSGKGGDLIKFQKSRITHLVCADISDVSLDNCKDRYRNMSKEFTCEFVCTDCSRNLIREHLSNETIQFDLTSCQFSFHYCFESYQQARIMVKNASDSLKIGGIFLATMPDSVEIVKRLKKSGEKKFGNDVYSIEFEKTYEDYVQDSGFPLFGAKYDFHLDDCVNCPEFLVYFPALVEICASFGLKLLFKSRFDEFYLEHKDKPENFDLMNVMDTLEKYPPKDNESLAGSPEDYRHINQYLESQTSSEALRELKTLGTLSKAQWEAITLYLIFSFQKVSNGPI